MPSVAGNGVDFSGPEDATNDAAGALRRRMSASGISAFAARVGAAGSSNGGASPMHAAAADSWLLQKLKTEWSACDLGPLLTKERLSDVVASFPHLDTPIKVRLLLSFLSMRKEDFDASKFAVVEIVDAAEKDNEEWVKVGAGLVNQYLFMSRDGAESGTFLHDQLATASASVLNAVRLKMDAAKDDDAASDSNDATRVVVIEDFFCHENAYLSASVRPELAVQPAAHFTIAADAPGNGTRHSGGPGTSGTSSSSASSSMATSQSGNRQKPPAHRPQLARPGMGSASASASTSASTSASAVPVRTASLSSKPLKKNMSELSSEIRRKADAGRFKRQRSRISVIDLDEVKQIETEKALKAEEQKKRLKATKDDKKHGSAAGTGNGVGSSTTEGGVGVDNTGDKHGSEEEGGHDAPLQESQYSEQDEHHDSDRDDLDSSFHSSHGGAVATGRSGGTGYAVQDGTQALLHAAFHSTGDVMKEVVGAAQHTHQPMAMSSFQQHDYYHQRPAAMPPPPPQQQQQQSLYANRGFEPEDVHATSHAVYGSNNNAYGYGAGSGSGSGSGYAAQFNDQAAGVPYIDQGGVPYIDSHPYGSNNHPGGFADDSETHQHQQQQQGDGSTHYDNSRDRGGFLEGPPEYWR